MRNVYKDCLEIQDASNYSGVARAFGVAIEELCREREWLRENECHLDLKFHPVCIWWMSKLASLSQIYFHDQDLLDLSYPLLTLLGSDTIEMKSDAHLARMRRYASRVEKLIKLNDRSVIHEREGDEDGA